MRRGPYDGETSVRRRGAREGETLLGEQAADASALVVTST
jgi:hypothetical protein